MIRFIAEHKDHQVAGPDGGAGLRWGVEPMCAVLSEHGVPISPSTYYEWIAKTPTRRQLRDAELVEIITAARDDRKTGKFVQTLGSRKLWIRLRGHGHDVARCTVERITARTVGRVHVTVLSSRPPSPMTAMPVTPIWSTDGSTLRRQIGCGWPTCNADVGIRGPMPTPGICRQFLRWRRSTAVLRCKRSA